MDSAPIKIASACTRDHVGQLHRQIVPQLATRQQITIDLGEMASIDAAGAQLLLSIKNSAESQNKMFELINPPEFFLQSLQAIGVDHHFTRGCRQALQA